MNLVGFRISLVLDPRDRRPDIQVRHPSEVGKRCARLSNDRYLCRSSGASRPRRKLHVDKSTGAQCPSCGLCLATVDRGLRANPKLHYAAGQRVAYRHVPTLAVEAHDLTAGVGGSFSRIDMNILRKNLAVKKLSIEINTIAGFNRQLRRLFAIPVKVGALIELDLHVSASIEADWHLISHLIDTLNSASDQRKRTRFERLWSEQVSHIGWISQASTTNCPRHWAGCGRDESVSGV